MKIGIVSELNTQTANFGNHLQAYALNLYLRRMHPDHQVDSVIFAGKTGVKYTNILSWSFCSKVVQSLRRRVTERLYGVPEGARIANNETVNRRLSEFAEFRVRRSHCCR